MQRMESDPRVGTTSGKPWFVHPQRGTLVPEICGDEMSVGLTNQLSSTVLPGRLLDEPRLAGGGPD
jgi:hypothetical protein